MESHDLLSNAQRTYLTSQDNEITNLSEQKSIGTLSTMNMMKLMKE